MIEIFAGYAVLCSIAKQAGMTSSLAIDKIRKQGARCSIHQLDLTLAKDQCLLREWMQSPLLIWIHLAPVCGTASRARDIRLFAGDPQPLRSDDFPDGLPDLSPKDQQRVTLANLLFKFSCEVFLAACARGILVTMENPRSSYFWCTSWLLHILLQFKVYHADFQVCMYGSTRDKWTRIIGNFSNISALSLKCDRTHNHEGWGFATDNTGRKVWATALESRYPRKLCIALVDVALQFASNLGLTLKSERISDVVKEPLSGAQQSRIAANQQPRPARIPPIVPEFPAVISVCADKTEDVPCALMSKLQANAMLTTDSGVPVEVPKHARLLRLSSVSDTTQKGESSVEPSPTKVTAVFGMPWTWEKFVKTACESGHPASKDMGVPSDLQSAIAKHVEWSDAQLSSFRLHWGRKWLKRSAELAAAEDFDRASRDKHVAELTKGKRILLFKEMLTDISYEDVECHKLLVEGASLAGEVSKCAAFESLYKPCLQTINQLILDCDRKKRSCDEFDGQFWKPCSGQSCNC